MHSDDVLPAGELDGAGTLVLVGHLAAMSLSNSKRYLWALSVSLSQIPCDESIDEA